MVVLPTVTALFASVIFLASGIASSLAPATAEGTYQTPGGPAVHWQINDHHTLFWDGQPYMPVGARIPGNPEAVNSAHAAGITDVIVELPANGSGWKETFDALERNSMSYLIAVNSAGPTARGISVAPASFRVDGITEGQHLDFPMPGTRSVLAILATRRDGALESVNRIQIIDGHFRMDVAPLNDLEHVLLLYPDQVSMQQPDFWDELDNHRDLLISSLKRNSPGKGLRGLVNPMGAVIRLPAQGTRFVPTNPYFRLEISSYLETKYKNLQTALTTWSLSSSDIDSFDQLARLVPLWSGSRGVSQLWDPVTDKLYQCDSKLSLAWRDIDDVIAAASDRRFRRLVAALRGVVNVPIVQDWAGWAAPYETPDPALDGVGVRTDSASPGVLADESGRGMSSVFRWRKAGWAPATRIDLTREKEAPSLLPGVLDDLASIGSRGWFVRADDAAMLKAVASEAQRRSADAMLADDSPKPIYFPESARNPASTQRLPGGHWWLPSSADGNRIDLGTQFSAYRIVETRGSTLAIWSQGPSRRVKLRLLNPKGIKFATLDGTDPSPKLDKSDVEVMVTQTPLLISGIEEIPVPEISLTEVVAQFDALTKIADDSRRDISDDKFTFQDNLRGFDRNPGGSFVALVSVVRRLTQKLAPYTWIEAESYQQTNFSEAVPVSGCSGGSALSLAAVLSNRKYTADYAVRVKTGQDQEVWLAARIPEIYRSKVKLIIGGQTLFLSGDGVSPYGQGYAWYRFGMTKLAGGRMNLRFEVDAAGDVDLALDAIVLSPGEFRPNGVRLPGDTTFQPSTRP